VAAVTIRIHYSKMVTMLKADNPDMGGGHAATEAKILRRFRELVTNCVAPRLGPELVGCPVLHRVFLIGSAALPPSPPPLIRPPPTGLVQGTLCFWVCTTAE